MSTANVYGQVLRLRRAAAFKLAPVARAVEAIADWRERSRSRRLLGALDDNMLRDIGVDRATASTEADKPFWRP